MRHQGITAFKLPKPQKQEKQMKEEREPAATPSPSLYIHTSIMNGKRCDSFKSPHSQATKSDRRKCQKVSSSQATGFFFLRTRLVPGYTLLALGKKRSFE